jgi:hypothetical protein
VTRERRGRFLDYAIADKRAVKVLDDVEELLSPVGELIEGCPRYRVPEPPIRRRGRSRRWRR